MCQRVPAAVRRDASIRSAAPASPTGIARIATSRCLRGTCCRRAVAASANQRAPTQQHLVGKVIFQELVCTKVRHLFAEICHRGHTGSYSHLARFLAPGHTCKPSPSGDEQVCTEPSDSRRTNAPSKMRHDACVGRPRVELAGADDHRTRRMKRRGEGRPGKTTPIAAVSQEQGSDLLSVSHRSVHAAESFPNRAIAAPDK